MIDILAHRNFELLFPPEGVVLSGVEVGSRGKVDDSLDNVGFLTNESCYQANSVALPGDERDVTRR